MIIVAAEILAAVALAGIYIRSRIPKMTIEQQGQLITAMQGRLDELVESNKALYKQHLENERAIADLQGQIKVYKEIPLQDIAKSLAALEGLPKEVDRIVAAHANDIKSVVSHVDTQNVKKQFIGSEVTS